METWLWSLIGLLFFIIAILIVKIRLMQKSADEISDAFAERIKTDTNTLIDISSRDRFMRALAEHINEELRKLRSERRLFLKGDLAVKDSITNISHDLRTPLTAICGYLDLLEEEEKSVKAAHYLNVIKNRTEMLKQLTEELFCYSLVTSTAQNTSLEKVTLNHVLEESLSAHYAALVGCQINPVISMPEQKIIRNLNKHALSRIFENILGNAMKYSDGDLRITLSKHGEITFSNHASGLNEIQANRLFDRLYTVETAEKSTGLGLSIAKTLTEQMNGTITAQYTDGVLSINILF